MDARYDIAGLGNALVDALVRLENDTVISDLGLTRGQMHPVDDSRWHECLSAVEDKGVDLQTGGSCANTLATLGLLGARTLYCGQVGDDRLGRVYREQLESACGGHSLFTSKDLPTGKCL
ncbi:MAG: PfkB family carbohydrate kinase, partial [Myxococcota bacterium]|nr:PfkB family carbohydrate kinase [Myxococcota bacterium]